MVPMSDAAVETNLVEVTPTDLSLDAALEIEEVLRGEAPSSPSLSKLVDALKAPQPAYSGGSVSMLSDVRSTRIWRSALRAQPPRNSASYQEIQGLISTFLDSLLHAVAVKDKETLLAAKRFCLDLNREFLMRNYEEIVTRQRRDETR